ncbi:MAG: DUF6134 family protein [Bacteroidota bacterium]
MKQKLAGIIFISTLIFVVLLPVAAQFISMNNVGHRVYNIIRNNKIIGNLTVSSIKKNNQLFVRNEAKFNIQMVGSFAATAIATNTFRENTLMHATVQRTLNGKVKTDNEIKFNSGKYQVVKGKSSQEIKRVINYTVSSLFFIEPANVSEVFSEVYLQFLKVKKLAPAVYETNLPDGGLMTYTYHSGMLTNVVAKTNYATVQYQLKK